MTHQTAKTAGPMLGTTLFSFTNPFHARTHSFEDLLRKVAELGTGPGIEIIGFQVRGFPQVSDEFAARFRDLVAELNLKPTSLAINADVAIRRGKLMDDDEMAQLVTGKNWNKVAKFFK